MNLYTILLIIALVINGAVQLTPGSSENAKIFWFWIAMGMAIGSFFAF